MKALFSNPPWFEKTAGVLRKGVRAGSRWPNTYSALCHPDQWTDGHYIPYPMFLGYAATYTAKHTGADVTLRDSIALHEGYASFYRAIQELRPDVLVMESHTPCWDHDKGVLGRIHGFLPNCRLVVVGPIAHPSAGHQDEILGLPGVVACIAGEYEKGCVRVVNGETGKIPFEALTKAEMNAAPFPWYDAHTVWRYLDACPHSPILPQAQIWASRGCLYKCAFCSWPSVMTNDDPDGTGKRSVRHYTADYIEAFVRELVGKYRIRSVYFDDDTFNLGNKHVAGICDVMRKLRMPWAAMCRADTVTRETWKLMFESGCYGVKIGFESGVQSIVTDVIGKDLDLKAARDTVIFLRNLGMTVHGTFTYGHPGETVEQMQATKAFIRSMPLNSWQESGTAPLEGTPLAAEEAKKHTEGFRTESDGNKKYAAIREELARL